MAGLGKSWANRVELVTLLHSLHPKAVHRTTYATVQSISGTGYGGPSSSLISRLHFFPKKSSWCLFPHCRVNESILWRKEPVIVHFPYPVSAHSCPCQVRLFHTLISPLSSTSPILNGLKPAALEWE